MSLTRRSFLSSSLTVATLPGLLPFLGRAWPESHRVVSDARIDRIELFRYDINIPRYFSWGTWHNRQHLFMKITSGQHYGWSEIPASINNPDFDPREWAAYLTTFQGLGMDQALRMLASQQVPGTSVSTKQLEFMEMGLLDLSGRLHNKPAIELLGLTGREAVPGLFCILNNDLKQVKQNARRSVKQGLDGHMKIKMYGDQELDLKILKAVRKIIRRDAVIISDASEGYKDWKNLNELTRLITNFHTHGLQAMEDPTALSTQQWINLQQSLGEFALIPDVPLRPAWKGLVEVQAGMGKIYNLHPSTMGSFSDVAKLAHKVESFGAQVMIGDDSLVGPACSAWQQIAIGAGAVWVEAIEKEGDSDKYLACLESSATYRDEQGKFAMHLKPGFGIEINEKKLKEISAAYVSL